MITNVTVSNLFVITPHKPLRNPILNVYLLAPFMCPWHRKRNKRDKTVYSSSMFSFHLKRGPSLDWRWQHPISARKASSLCSFGPISQWEDFKTPYGISIGHVGEVNKCTIIFPRSVQILNRVKNQNIIVNVYKTLRLMRTSVVLHYPAKSSVLFAIENNLGSASLKKIATMIY